MTRMLGTELAALLDAYCARHKINRVDFAAAAGLGAPCVMEIGAKAFPSQYTAMKVTTFIAAHPDGPGGVQGVVGGGGEPGGAAALAKAKALSLPSPTPIMSAGDVAARERAPARRVTPEYRARLRAASAPESIATALVETPADLIATVRRQWPDQWQRIVDQAREAGTLPGAMLAQVIERGLEAGA